MTATLYRRPQQWQVHVQGSGAGGGGGGGGQSGDAQTYDVGGEETRFGEDWAREGDDDAGGEERGGADGGGIACFALSSGEKNEAGDSVLAKAGSERSLSVGTFLCKVRGFNVRG